VVYCSRSLFYHGLNLAKTRLRLTERRRLMGSRRVLVLVAALNEEEGIGYTLAELRKVLDPPPFLL